MMKKLLFGLSLLAVLAATSCKKAKNTAADAANATTNAVSNGADAVGDAASSAVEAGTDAVNNVADAVQNLGVEVPSFSTEEGKQWADNLVEAANKVKNDALAGDTEAMNADMQQFSDVATNQIKSLQGSADFGTATKFAAEMIEKVKNF